MSSRTVCEAPAPLRGSTENKICQITAAAGGAGTEEQRMTVDRILHLEPPFSREERRIYTENGRYRCHGRILAVVSRQEFLVETAKVVPPVIESERAIRKIPPGCCWRATLLDGSRRTDDRECATRETEEKRFDGSTRKGRNARGGLPRLGFVFIISPRGGCAEQFLRVLSSSSWPAVNFDHRVDPPPPSAPSWKPDGLVIGQATAGYGKNSPSPLEDELTPCLVPFNSGEFGQMAAEGARDS
ncbi:hypothetical protein KM043_003608 [Ampulex compressa]|nr:hypothetical protein KM043_003608 [Ampulex compressa]